MVNYALIENIAGIIFPTINMIFILLIFYQFFLLFRKPRGHMYYRPWYFIFFSFIFFSFIQIITLFKKLSLIKYPIYINSILELFIIISLIYVVFAIKMRKLYHPYHHLEIKPKKIDIK
jgi:hypothetical protein